MFRAVTKLVTARGDEKGELKMEESISKIVVFPAIPSHTIEAGDGAVEIKHTHPEYQNEEERAQRLKELRRTCTLLVRAQRQAATARQGRSA